MVNFPSPEPSADTGITYRTAKPEDGVALRQYLVQVSTETDFLSQSAQDPPMSETQVAQTISQAVEGPNQLLLLAVEGELGRRRTPLPLKQTVAFKTASTEVVQSLSNLYPREETHAKRR